MKNAPSRSLLMSTAIALALGRALSSQAAIYVWNVATPAANNWNVNGNWNAAGFPGNADTAIFNATGSSANATTVNNVVSVDTTVASLAYTNIVNNTWHVTQIPSGVTLTVTNLVVGYLTNDTAVALVAMTGGGTLQVFGANMNVGACGADALPPATSQFDVSGLNNFIYLAPTWTNSLGIGHPLERELQPCWRQRLISNARR